MHIFSEIGIEIFSWSWTIDVLIRVSVVLAIGLTLSIVLRRVSASVKHSLLAACLVCCLIIPLATLWIPGWKLPNVDYLLKTEPLAAADHSPSLLQPANLPANEINFQPEQSADTELAESSSAVKNRRPDNSTTKTVQNPEPETEAIIPANPNGRSTNSSWPLVVWSIGFCLAILPLVIAIIRKHQWLQRADSIKNPGWQELVTDLSGQLEVRNHTRLYRSRQNIIPVTWGFWRPVILLPADCDSWSEQRRRSVLLHELAHIKRSDSVVQLVTRFACSVYWLHPLAWACLLKIRFERELACDDSVVNAGQPASEYANELVEIAQVYRTSGRLQTGVAMARSSKLKSRLESLFDSNRSHQTYSRRFSLLLAVVTSLFALAVSGFDGSQDSVQEQEQEPGSSVDSLGDSLPPGALLRMGSIRFQHPDGVDAIALTNDEKTIVSLSSEKIIGWDSTTGVAKWEHEPNFAHLGMGLVFTSASYGMRPLTRIPGTNRFYLPSSDNRSIAICDSDTGKFENLDIDFSDVDFSRPSQGCFKSIDVSADGDLIAIGNFKGLVVCESSGKARYVIPNNPATAIQTLTGQRDRRASGGEYSYGVFSPDQEQLAVVTSENPNMIRIVDAETGEPSHSIETNGRLARMDFTPMGQSIVATENDCAVGLYDIESGENLWSLKFPIENNGESYTHEVKVSPNGDIVAVAAPMGADNRIRIVEVETGEQIASLTGHAWKPMTLQFSDDGETLFSSGWDGSILSWNMQSYELNEPAEGERTTGMACACPVNNVLAYKTSKGQLKLIDSTNGQLMKVIDMPGYADEAISFSPDGTKIAAGGQSESDVLTGVWDVASGEKIHEWKWAKGRDPHSNITDLCFSPDGSKIGVANFRQRRGFLLDLETKEQKYSFQHQGVYGLSFDSTGRILTTVGWDSAIKFWNAETGDREPTANVQFPQQGEEGYEADLRMYDVCYSPCGERYATLHMQANTRIWKTGDKSLLSEHSSGAGTSTGTLDFSNDGIWLAVGDRDGQVRIYDSFTGDVVMTKQAHPDSVISINFCADGQSLLTGGSEGVSYLWSLRPEQKEPQPITDLYAKLIGSDSAAAFQAHWAMLNQPVDSIEHLTAQLLDNKDLEPGKPELLRALALLRTIATDDSEKLLQSISQQHPDTFLGEQANRLAGK